jgi:NAD(P)H-nitrite reductase large subunit
MSVTEAEIVSAIQQGADSLEKISDETFAATNCGTCSGQILMILQRELKNKKTT